MDKIVKKQTNNDAMESAAIEEAEINSSDLTQEILPLLTECFWGEITVLGRCIRINFPNGQKFSVSVEEA